MLGLDGMRGSWVLGLLLTIACGSDGDGVGPLGSGGAAGSGEAGAVAGQAGSGGSGATGGGSSGTGGSAGLAGTGGQVTGGAGGAAGAGGQAGIAGSGGTTNTGGAGGSSTGGTAGSGGTPQGACFPPSSSTGTDCSGLCSGGTPPAECALPSTGWCAPLESCGATGLLVPNSADYHVVLPAGRVANPTCSAACTKACNWVRLYRFDIPNNTCARFTASDSGRAFSESGLGCSEKSQCLSVGPKSSGQPGVPAQSVYGMALDGAAPAWVRVETATGAACPLPCP